MPEPEGPSGSCYGATPLTSAIERAVRNSGLRCATSAISRAVSMMVVLGVSIGVGTVALAAFLLGVGAIAAVIIVVMLAPFILLFRWLA